MTGYGARIREARGGLSQRQLGELIGKKQSSINDWEHETSEPSLSDFRRLAAATGKTTTWLAFGDDNGAAPTAKIDRELVHKAIAAIERRIARKPLFRPDPAARANMILALHDMAVGRAIGDKRDIDQVIEDLLDALTKG